MPLMDPSRNSGISKDAKGTAFITAKAIQKKFVENHEFESTSKFVSSLCIFAFGFVSNCVNNVWRYRRSCGSIPKCPYLIQVC